MRRVAKAAARRTRLKDGATAPLEGVALVTGVLSLFAFTLAAVFVGVALLIASSWGEDPRAFRAAARRDGPEGDIDEQA